LRVPQILKVVQIGNSKGVPIPKQVLKRLGMPNEVDCIETIDGLLLHPGKKE